MKLCHRRKWSNIGLLVSALHGLGCDTSRSFVMSDGPALVLEPAKGPVQTRECPGLLDRRATCRFFGEL